MRAKRSDGLVCRIGSVIAVACLVVFAPQMAAAFDVQIHGYGNQDFMMANKTDYFGAAEGTWEHNSMSLVFTANATDDTSIWAKVFADPEGTTMEWLYVDKKLGSGFDLRAGQMKLPVGALNLIRDNKFLHLAETEPAIYSDFVEIVQENFRGVGLEYNWEWLTVEAIGGAPQLEEENAETSELTGPNQITETTTEAEVRKLIGGRIKVRTPLPGLSLMFSGSRYNEELTVNERVLDLTTGTTTPNSTRVDGVEKVWIASLEYDNHDLEVKAEYARKSGLEAMNEKFISYYGEAGYTFFEKLTPYVRYDWVTTNIYDKGNPANFQADTTVGIGYRINDYIKVKVENHFITGFALAAAEKEGDPDLDATRLAERWNLFVAGVNFMF